MFTCSICDETFVGVHQNSCHAARCGHVFHYHCILKWLERSQTCPHCRSIVLKDDLIKLFLQVDPKARIAWNKEVEEKLYSLNCQVQVLNEKNDILAYSFFHFESQLKLAKNKNEQNDKTIQLFQAKCNDYESQMNSLQKRLMALTVKRTVLDQKQKIEAQLQVEKSKVKSLSKIVYELPSANLVVFDKLRSDIADLKSENAYYKNKCNNLESTNDNSPSISKLIDENKENNLHQIHHVTGSTTKLLCGCVFLIIEDHNSYEDRCNDPYMSKFNIIEHGGSVDTIYSPRITHIICSTQNHYLVQQGLKDVKRCVTGYWLIDVIAKKKMRRPWLALHFPSLYSKETDLPCQQYQIAIANFDEHMSQLVKTMIKLTGACVVDEVSSTTDVVISLKLEGELVETALALNRPVVNVQWLNAILFGAQIDIHNPMFMNYQQFDLEDPFSVNYEMVSDFMVAWNHPFHYLTCNNQEAYYLMINGPTSSKHKRQKKETENPELLIDLADDNNGFLITNVWSNYNIGTPLVMFCGFSIEEEEKLKQIVLQLGGNMAGSFKGTHLIMKKPLKSIMFLQSLSSVTYIVNEFWLTDSQSSLTFKSELDYCIGKVYDEFNTVVCNVPEILKIKTRKSLFKDKHFFFTPGIKCPPVINLQEMVNSAGGTFQCLINTNFIQYLSPSTQHFPPMHYIISCEEDFHLIADLFINSNKVVYSPGFVIHSIMQQRLMWEYVVSKSGL